MILYHWTTREAWEEIRGRGLDPRKSRGKRRWVWLLEGAAVHVWLSHVAEHQDRDPYRMVLLAVVVPRAVLTHRGRGRWTTSLGIPACNVWFLGDHN